MVKAVVAVAATHVHRKLSLALPCMSRFVFTEKGGKERLKNVTMFDSRKLSAEPESPWEQSAGTTSAFSALMLSLNHAAPLFQLT